MTNRSLEPRLRGIASKFRESILAVNPADRPSSLENFPLGSCGDSTDLLASHLEETGFGASDYVLGMKKGASHAWLQIEGLIVDITADQFEDGPGQVVVVPQSDWHDGWSARSERRAGLRHTSGPTSPTLRRFLSLLGSITESANAPVEHTESRQEADQLKSGRSEGKFTPPKQDGLATKCGPQLTNFDSNRGDP